MGFLGATQRIGVAAVLLAASAFLSRVMGLLRDKIISWQYGAGSEADMYFAAFVVPDIINYLLAGGFISITIIPVISQCFREDENEAWRLFSCILLWMFSAATLFTLICSFRAPVLAHIIAPGFSPGQIARLAFFMRIILPGQIFFLSGACFTALLLLRRQFAVPALTPLIYNSFIIIFGVTLPLLFQRANNDIGMTGYCIGVTTGACAGAFILPFFVALKGGIRFTLTWWHPKMSSFFYVALPLMLGQTVVMLDEQFLRIFGSMLSEGNISLLNYARRIAQVPVALLGQAIAAASYPFLVNLLTQKQYDKFDQTLNNALAAGLNLIIPCSGLMIAASTPILGIIFLGGQFHMKDISACQPLTAIMLAAAPFWILYMVLARAFYARENTLTPAVTGTVITLVCLPSYYFFALPMGARGIALVSSFSIAVYAIWLMFIWIKRHGKTPFSGLLQDCVKSLLLTLFASASVLLFNSHATSWTSAPDNFLKMSLFGILDAAIFLSVFIGLGYLLFPDYIIILKKLLPKKQR